MGGGGECEGGALLCPDLGKHSNCKAVGLDRIGIQCSLELT